MQGMLRCGSLSHVDDDGPRPKPARASPTGGEPNFINRRLRKIRGKRDKDPLSLVGSDIDVEYPLAALERRQCASSSRHCNSPRCRKDASHEEDDERLRRLQNMIYHRGDHALSEGTVASVRKRGLDEIGSTLVSTTSSLSNDTPHKAEEVGQRVIRKIHGKGVPVPLCPTCSGELTYLYISRRNQAIRACEIQNEDESTKEKLQNLLPPLCEQCRAHVLHEHSRCKQLMLENFNDWLESELDDGDGVKQSAVGPGDDPIISYHPLNAKLRVVNASPANRSDEQDQGVHVATSFASSQMEEPTPRLSNRSDRSESPSFGFVDGEVRTRDRPIFDSLSSSMSGGNRAYRRKGQISYDEKEEPNSGEVCDESHKEDDNQPGGRNEATVVDNIPADSMHTRRQGVSPDYFSDDDPFSSLDEAVTEEDEDETVIGAESTVSGGSECNGGLINEQRDDQLVKIAEIIANQSTGSIQIIRTESEELAILEQHSMKKEIATTQIAEGLVKGHELTPSQCDRCRMPMMKNGDDDEECVTCPIIERKAKRIAKQKRKALVARYVYDGQQGKGVDGNVQEEGALEHETVVVEDVDSDSDSEAQISYASTHHGLEETEDMNALEEGLAGSNSCGDTLDVSIIDGQSSVQQQSASLSVDLNPYGGQSSDGCDYWVRHSSSQLQAARTTQTSQHSVVSDEGSRQCPGHENQYQRSVSEVSEGQVSSVVTSNSNRHNFSFSSDTIQKHQQQPAPEAEADQHLYQSLSNPHLESTSGVSIHHGSSDVSSVYHASLSGDAMQQTHICHSNLSSSEVSDCHPGDDQQPHGQRNSSSSEVSECHTASDESSTRCPRNFPSGEMIWHNGPHNCASEPSREYPVQSCAVESRSTSLDEPEIDPASTGRSQSSGPDGEGVQDTNVDLEPSESDCRAENKSLSNDAPKLQGMVERPVKKCQATDQTTRDSFPGTEINSLSARIARLLDALKEVAEQLPREEIEARRRIDQAAANQEICQTVEMRNNSSPRPENACTTPIRDISTKSDAVHDTNMQRCEKWNLAQESNEIAFQKGTKFRPIPSPLVVEHGSWRGHIQSPTRRKMLGEDAYSGADTENDQIAFWKHARDDTNPMQGSNIIGVPISPINIGARRHQIDLFGGGGAEQMRSSKERMVSPFSRQKVSSPQYSRPSSKRRHRKDPPGRRVDMWALDSRERSRPSDDIRCHSSTTPRYEGKQARDCPPEQLVKMTTSQRNSVTPKTRGCRPWVDKTPETEQHQYCPATAHSSGVEPSSSGGSKLRSHLVSAKPLPKDSVQLDTPWEDADAGASLQTSNSFGDSSLCQLFKQIDEIEDDFHTIVASLPGSEGQTISTKSSTGEDESLKSTYEKHSLVEVHLNNAGSFESNASEDTTVTDVVQRMRRIKDYIERVDSGDESEGSRCSYQSSGEMTELLQKLEQAAESLRALDGDWED